MFLNQSGVLVVSDNTLTKKQQQVVDVILKEAPEITLLSGAKRAGKTYVLIILFLMHVAKYEGERRRFILGGANQGSIRRNVLTDLETILGRSITLDKANTFMLFGNMITCFDGSDSSSYKAVRGFTSHGALLNEATTLNEHFIQECMDRCSGDGAKIYMDTNPENPAHFVKTDFYDANGKRSDNGQLLIYSTNFTLFDNDKLPKSYIDRQLELKPSGMFYDRDILGEWVSGEGVVYPDFDRKVHFIRADEVPYDDIVDAWAGVDWGYDHYGSIVVVLEDSKGKRYMVEEYAERHQDIDYWVEVAREIAYNYPKMKRDQNGTFREVYDIPFYCDSARPEHCDRFLNEGFNMIYADKAILDGIEIVASHFKNDMIYVVRHDNEIPEHNGCAQFEKEVYLYVWDNTNDKPKPKYDDVLDSLRYALLTHDRKPTWFNHSI